MDYVRLKVFFTLKATDWEMQINKRKWMKNDNAQIFCGFLCYQSHFQNNISQYINLEREHKRYTVQMPGEADLMTKALKRQN